MNDPRMMSSETNFYVYYLRRPDKEDPLWPGADQPFYVGKGCNGRVGAHRGDALRLLHKSGRKTNRISIIHKLWKQNLDFMEEIMFENLTEQEAHEIEIEAIQVYGRIDLGTGCLANMTDGGEGNSGYIHTDETKRKISNSEKGKIISKETRDKISKSLIGRKPPPFTEDHRRNMGNSKRGRPLSEGHKQKLSNAKIGNSNAKGSVRSEEYKKNLSNRIVSDKTRELMSLAKKNKYNGENNPFYGKHHTIETKEKLRIAAEKQHRKKLKRIPYE